VIKRYNLDLVYYDEDASIERNEDKYGEYLDVYEVLEFLHDKENRLKKILLTPNDFFAGQSSIVMALIGFIEGKSKSRDPSAKQIANREALKERLSGKINQEEFAEQVETNDIHDIL